MDPMFLLILGVVAIAVLVAVVLRRGRDAAMPPDEHLEQVALRGEQDRQRTSAIEMADRTNLNGPPNP
jgi:hypothetical protein